MITLKIKTVVDNFVIDTFFKKSSIRKNVSKIRFAKI